MSQTASTVAASVGRGDRAGVALVDCFFALRPLLWIPAIALFEAGRTEAGGSWWPPVRALPPLASLLALLGAVHLANGWNDRAGDRLNRKGGLVATGAIPGRDLAIGAVLLVVLGAALASCPVVTSAARIWLVAALALGAAYVLPPFEWKRRPALDLLSQAAGYGLVAYCLGTESAIRDPALSDGRWLRAAPYALGIATVGLVTMLADRAGDEAVGQRTTAVALGAPRTERVAQGLATVTSFAGLFAGAWAPALWGFIALALLCLGDFTGAPRAGRWNQVAVSLQVAFVILLLPRTPLPLIAAGAIGVAVATYDRARGGRGYPWSVMTTGRGESEEGSAIRR